MADQNWRTGNPRPAPTQQDGWIAGSAGGNPGVVAGTLESVPVVGGLIGAMDPASPYRDLQKGLGKASQQAQYNANLQWQRQMQGLAQALGFQQHSQDAFNNVYGHMAQRPGAALPQGLSAQLPQSGAPQGGPGLAAYLGRGR